MNAEQHAKSSRHYEREAETTRHRLAQRLDELSDRLTPGRASRLSYSRLASKTWMVKKPGHDSCWIMLNVIVKYFRGYDLFRLRNEVPRGSIVA